MTAEEHNKTLATLYLIYGAMHGLTLVGLLLLVTAVWFATPVASSISWFWLGCGVVTFLVLLFLVGLLPLALGYALRKRRRWAKPLGLSLAVASMINIPIGTALGIYTIKFFRSEGGVVLYGGKSSTVAPDELQEALRGAQPLMDWANRSKSDQHEQKV
jgi:thiol:disulfide interchange protein